MTAYQRLSKDLMYWQATDSNLEMLQVSPLGLKKLRQHLSF